MSRFRPSCGAAFRRLGVGLEKRQKSHRRIGRIAGGGCTPQLFKNFNN